jgi:hypothetical protein
MVRHRALLLCALAVLSIAVVGIIPTTGSAQYAGVGPSPGMGGPTVVGPSQILYMDADSVYYIRSQEWWSANVKHQEKLLLRGVRMRYWSEHLPADMRLVYDALGYPVSRVLLTPVGHTEEWWYYKLLAPPLRFRDGILLNSDLFEAYLARR